MASFDDMDTTPSVGGRHTGKRGLDEEDDEDQKQPKRRLVVTQEAQNLLANPELWLEALEKLRGAKVGGFLGGLLRWPSMDRTVQELQESKAGIDIPGLVVDRYALEQASTPGEVIQVYIRSTFWDQSDEYFAYIQDPVLDLIRRAQIDEPLDLSDGTPDISFFLDRGFLHPGARGGWPTRDHVITMVFVIHAYERLHACKTLKDIEKTTQELRDHWHKITPRNAHPFTYIFNASVWELLYREDFLLPLLLYNASPETVQFFVSRGIPVDERH